MCIMFQGSILRLEFELSRLHNSGNIGLRGPMSGWKFLKLVTTSRVRSVKVVEAVMIILIIIISCSIKLMG